VSGASAPYTLQWQTGNTGFFVGTGPQLANPANCSATNQFPGGPAEKVISSITLPNGKAYRFSYDATYGFLSKIVYPNGGYVSYTWGVNTQSDMVYWYDSFGNFPGCEVRYSPPAISHRYVSFDGVNIAQQQDFTYFTNWSSSNSPTWTYKTTTVKTTDFLTPGNPSTYTVYTYLPLTAPDPLNMESRTANQVPMESNIAYRDGAQVTKRTVIKTWVGALITSEQTKLENGQTSQTNYFYGTLGVLTRRMSTILDPVHPARCSAKRSTIIKASRLRHSVPTFMTAPVKRSFMTAAHPWLRMTISMMAEARYVERQALRASWE